MHKLKPFFLGFIFLGLFFVHSPQTPAQDEIEDLFNVTIRGGFDGYFRPNTWTPLHIRVENNGPTVRGRFVIRPETSGSAVANSFSTPVDLPANTTQAFFLYLVARGNANVIRLELLDDHNSVITSRDFQLRPIQPRDSLYALISNTPRINLNTVNVGGYLGHQANWGIDDIPDEADALTSLNMMLFTDVDSAQLTPAQQRALELWVMRGGHLIVTGGSAWQETATNLEHLLPFIPNGSTTTNDIQSLIELGGDYNTALVKEVIIAEGDVIEGAMVLAENSDGMPLVTRRQLGHGTVDYIAIDPVASSIRNWANLPRLWFTLVTSTDARPSWSHGLSQWDSAASAIEIIPGLDLLPPTLTLAGFLITYLIFIGPLNYLILKRLNRLEYAWITIPVLIIIFSVMAWLVGYELRGDKVILSRIGVVQSWADTDDAHIEQLIGLLAPRRGEYGIQLEDERLLRPISGSVDSTVGISSSKLSSIEIRQGNTMEAVSFPIDASFIAAFTTSGIMEKPAISGDAVFTFNNEDNYLQLMQGVVRNESDLTLEDAVILTNGQAVYLNDPLEPGDVYTFDSFDVNYTPVDIPSATSLEYASFTGNPFFAVSTIAFRGSPSYYSGMSSQSVEQIMGSYYQEPRFSFNFSSDNIHTKEQRRRQQFLESFIIDQFAATSRGNQIYLFGWSNGMPTTEIIDANEKETFDTTLYIIELEAERTEPLEDGLDIVTPDQFTWVSLLRDGVNDVGPVRFSLAPDSGLAFRYTPLPDAVLETVSEMTVFVERSRPFSDTHYIEVWNWETNEWEPLGLPTKDIAIILNDPQPYIGPQNAVQIRVRRLDLLADMIFTRISIEQRGDF